MIKSQSFGFRKISLQSFLATHRSVRTRNRDNDGLLSLEQVIGGQFGVLADGQRHTDVGVLGAFNVVDGDVRGDLFADFDGFSLCVVKTDSGRPKRSSCLFVLLQLWLAKAKEGRGCDGPRGTSEAGIDGDGARDGSSERRSETLSTELIENWKGGTGRGAAVSKPGQ